MANFQRYSRDQAYVRNRRLPPDMDLISIKVREAISEKEKNYFFFSVNDNLLTYNLSATLPPKSEEEKVVDFTDITDEQLLEIILQSE